MFNTTQTKSCAPIHPVHRKSVISIGADNIDVPGINRRLFMMPWKFVKEQDGKNL